MRQAPTGRYQDGSFGSEAIGDESASRLKRQRDFCVAADYAANALTSLSVVRRIVLFGSVGKPLNKEVPRFRKFRRAGVTLWHESRCQGCLFGSFPVGYGETRTRGVYRRTYFLPPEPTHWMGLA